MKQRGRKERLELNDLQNRLSTEAVGEGTRQHEAMSQGRRNETKLLDSNHCLWAVDLKERTTRARARLAISGVPLQMFVMFARSQDS